jgi:hypothetical protein
VSKLPQIHSESARHGWNWICATPVRHLGTVGKPKRHIHGDWGVWAIDRASPKPKERRCLGRGALCGRPRVRAWLPEKVGPERQPPIPFTHVTLPPAPPLHAPCTSPRRSPPRCSVRRPKPSLSLSRVTWRGAWARSIVPDFCRAALDSASRTPGRYGARLNQQRDLSIPLPTSSDRFRYWIHPCLRACSPVNAAYTAVAPRSPQVTCRFGSQPVSINLVYT